MFKVRLCFVSKYSIEVLKLMVFKFFFSLQILFVLQGFLIVLSLAQIGEVDERGSTSKISSKFFRNIMKLMSFFLYSRIPETIRLSWLSKFQQKYGSEQFARWK